MSERMPLDIAEEEIPKVLPAGWRVLECALDGYAIQSMFIAVLVSFSIERDGATWKHISVSRRDGTVPSWLDLQDARNIVVKSGEHAYMVWPRRDEYVDLSRRVGKEVMHMFVPLRHRPLPDFRLGIARDAL